MIYLNFRNSYEGSKFSFSIIFFVSNPFIFDIFSNRLWLCFWGRPELSFVSFKLR